MSVGAELVGLATYFIAKVSPVHEQVGSFDISVNHVRFLVHVGQCLSHLAHHASCVALAQRPVPADVAIQVPTIAMLQNNIIVVLIPVFANKADYVLVLQPLQDGNFV